MAAKPKRGSTDRPAVQAPVAPRPRIETQIHRRKKAKALSELQPEWEQEDAESPQHLRMAEERMAPRRPNVIKR